MNKTKVPAVEGLFTMDSKEPRLIGNRCKNCGSYYFPKETIMCKNPDCVSHDFEDALLSRQGKLWSYTTNYYKPPAPYVSPDPFKPYSIAAVELDEEKMIVLGQIADDCDCRELKIGVEMELILEKLYEDEKNEYITWKWKPVKREVRQ